MGKIKLDPFQKDLLNLKHIGLDTMCFIYQFANHPIYSVLTNIIFQLLEKNKITTITSMVTIAETFVQAERNADTFTILEYEETFQQLPHLQIIHIDWSLARVAAKLRASYTFMKTPDALQIGAALLKGCRGFITNDERLEKIKETKVIILKNYL